MKTLDIIKSTGKVLIAPFIGLFYATLLPFAFFYAIGVGVLKGIASIVGSNISFGWRPLESYLAGRKNSSKRDNVKKDQNPNS